MSTHDDDEPLSVSVKKAAHLLGVCTKTLYRMHTAEKIIFRKKFGRTLVPMSEVKRLNETDVVRDSVEEKPGHVGEPVGEPPKARPKKVKLYPQHA